MVALRRMARSQEKINESQELTTQDDTHHSASSGTTRRNADGNDERERNLRVVGTERWRRKARGILEWKL